MNKHFVKRKFSILIVLISVINVSTLFIWFLIKISPIIPRLESINNIAINKEINNNYDTFKELYNDIDSLSLKYDITFNIYDKNNKEITDIKLENDIVLFSYMVNVENNTYLIKAYSNKNVGISSLFFGLFVFQVIVITIIFSVTLSCSKKIIFKPIDDIINVIKNYKLGKKPIKKKVTTEFDLIQNEFVHLTEQLDKEKEEQNRIIASISHDIKTPLTSIIGYSNLINDGSVSVDEIKRYNDKILSKSIHIKELVTQFDDYLLNQEKVTLKLDNILIRDLIKELDSDYRVELKNINIRFNIKSNISNIYIKMDILKMKRVFSNIISNSIRYLKDGGVINVDIVDDKDYIKFIISDNGPGINEDLIDKIFDPFFTTDNSRKISGLGLSICKEFIDMHGGDINAYNDNGLTVEFRLPK